MGCVHTWIAVGTYPMHHSYAVCIDTVFFYVRNVRMKFLAKQMKYTHSFIDFHFEPAAKGSNWEAVQVPAPDNWITVADGRHAMIPTAAFGQCGSGKATGCFALWPSFRHLPPHQSAVTLSISQLISQWPVRQPADITVTRPSVSWYHSDPSVSQLISQWPFRQSVESWRERSESSEQQTYPVTAAVSRQIQWQCSEQTDPVTVVVMSERRVIHIRIPVPPVPLMDGCFSGDGPGQCRLQHSQVRLCRYR